MTPPWAISARRSLMRSQPLSFASSAVLNSARSPTDPIDVKCCRIAQICCGLRGAFAPVIRPAFQGLRGMRKRSGWPMAASQNGGPRLSSLRLVGRECAKTGHFPTAGEATFHWRCDAPRRTVSATSLEGLRHREFGWKRPVVLEPGLDKAPDIDPRLQLGR